MRYFLSLILVIFALTVNGQSIDEFEGSIEYTHTFIFTNPQLDTSMVKNFFGVSSKFYYKNGNYKWIIQSVPVQTEYFDYDSQTIFFLYDNNRDTLFRSVRNGHDDSLKLFTEDTVHQLICNHMCSSVETISFEKTDPEFWIKRTLFYSPDIPIDPQRFYMYRTYGSNQVFKKIKSWPLLIQLESSFGDFIFIIKAVNVVPGKIADADIGIPTEKPVADLRIF